MSYSVSDMIIEVFENLGESSDLYPYNAVTGYPNVDVTTIGASRILKWLNKAYRKVCNTQLGDGTFVRFRSLERNVNFVSGTVATTVSAIGGSLASNQIQIAGLYSLKNKYVNWIIDLQAADANSQGSEQHVVIASDTSSPPILTLADNIVTTPTVGDPVNIYKKFWACSLNTSNVHPNEFIPVDPKEDFLSALWVYDIIMQKDIRRYDERTPLYKQVLNRLYPGMFFDLETPAGGWYDSGIAGGIEFDVAPVDGSGGNGGGVFELHYYGLSELLTTAAQVPRVPDPFVDLIVLGASRVGMIRDREWDASYAMRKDIEAGMQTLIQDGALRFEYDFPSLWLES